MKTCELYYLDGSIREFDAVVLSCVPGKDSGRYSLILDRTAFYPGGGGQTADRGYFTTLLSGQEQDKTLLLSVHRNGEAIIHDVDRELAEGTAVHGFVDDAHRRHYMQQHTGQHLLSAVMYREHSLDTVSVHLGEDYTSIEIVASDFLSDDTIRNIEDTANMMIRTGIAIREHRAVDSAGDIELRRELKVDSGIRIIKIGGYDEVGCGGVHCASTADIVYLFFEKQERVRGNLRLFWKIGDRAVQELRQNRTIITSLVEMFSSPPERLLESISSLQKKYAGTEYALSMAKKRLAREVAHSLEQRPLIAAGFSLYCCNEGDIDMEGLREIANMLCRKPGSVAIILSGGTDGNGQWIAGCHETCGFDFTRIKVPFLARIHGKGGGRHPQWQGAWSTGNTENLAADIADMVKKEYGKQGREINGSG